MRRSERVRCQNCEFYEEKGGECRLSPPTVDGFPKVDAYQWCGQFLLDPTIGEVSQ